MAYRITYGYFWETLFYGGLITLLALKPLLFAGLAGLVGLYYLMKL
jgi:hypothetical protein